MNKYQIFFMQALLALHTKVCIIHYAVKLSHMKYGLNRFTVYKNVAHFYFNELYKLKLVEFHLFKLLLLHEKSPLWYEYDSNHKGGFSTLSRFD